MINEYVESIDYKVIPPTPKDDRIYIQLLKEPYDGVTFKYGNVKVKEIDGEAHLVFQYTFVPSSKYNWRWGWFRPKFIKDLGGDQVFLNMIGDMLIGFVKNSINAGDGL